MPESGLVIGGVPVPPDLPASLVPLAFLLGRWEGVGVGSRTLVPATPPDGAPDPSDVLAVEYQFGQELVVTATGEEHLTWTSRTWELGPDGGKLAPAESETGYWRVVDGEVEVVLAHPDGLAELWVGAVTGQRLELRTDVVVRAPSSPAVTSGHRLYGLVEGELFWAYDRALGDAPLAPFMSARLRRPGAAPTAGAAGPGPRG